MPSRIEDYALIGDCETAALVARDGSIDWLCWPRFDSDACFAALLGTLEHGRWRLAPFGQCRGITRRYLGDTLILETRFETDQGSAKLIDFMPPRSGHTDLVRLVVGESGSVAMHMQLATVSPGLTTHEAFATTKHFWEEWAARASVAPGERHHAILRALITLKALTYAPTGGIVAAPTTSLPET